MDDIFCLQEICNIPDKCKNLAKNTLLARKLQVRYFLQGYCRIVIICKNLSRHIWFTKILEDVSYLQEFRKITARTLHNINCSQEPRKRSNNCNSLASYLFLQERCKVFNIWKKLARIPSRARILQDIYYLQ